MPLIFDFNEPAGQGNLGPVVSLLAQAASLPGFVALFDADAAVRASLAATPISTWPASQGTGSFTQAASARYPVDATRDGARVVSFNGANAMSLSGLVIGSPTDYTLAFRFYQKDYNVDAQVLFGHDLTSPTYRFMSRYTTANHYYRFDSDIDVDVEVPDVNGWHTVIICQGGGLAKVSMDGAAFVTAARATALLPALSIGNARDTGGSGRIDMRAIALLSTDLTVSAPNLALLRQIMAAV